MAKAKTTVYLDEDVLRAARVAAARSGKRDSEIVEEALRSYLAGGILDSIWAHQRNQGLELSEEEALELAYAELRAMRQSRADSAA
jgi:Ribbon-helix-helix protein, copG family